MKLILYYPNLNYVARALYSTFREIYKMKINLVLLRISEDCLGYRPKWRTSKDCLGYTHFCVAFFCYR